MSARPITPPLESEQRTQVGRLLADGLHQSVKTVVKRVSALDLTVVCRTRHEETRGQRAHHAQQDHDGDDPATGLGEDRRVREWH